MRNAAVWALVLAASTARAQGQLQEADRSEREEPQAQQVPLEQQQPRGQQQLQEQQPPIAQQPVAGAPAQDAAGPTSDAFDRACVDLLHGRTPEGEKAIRALKDACANLMGGRADERIEAEQQLRAQREAREQLRALAEGRSTDARVQRDRVQPGRAAEQVPPGEGVRAAFQQAASELTSPRRGAAMGMRRGGPVGYTLITNPFGWFTGVGVNAELHRAFDPKFSWVAGARYSATDASNGTAKTFGGMAGIDWYVVGRNNEGFHIGPRAEIAAGREEFQNSSTFARLGLSGEAGYSFIATNGLTGMLAVGLGGRVAGDDQNEDFASFVGGEFGPYLKAAFGFSW